MNKKFVGDVVVVIFGILILAVGYLYISGKLPQIKKSNTVTDETAGWKIYRDEEYGFEFKYPGFLNDIPKSNGGMTRSEKDDVFTFAIYERSLDLFEYKEMSDSYISFKYNSSINKWIPVNPGVDMKFAPQEYTIPSGGKVYTVETGDAAIVDEIAYVEPSDKSFVILMTLSWNQSWTDCINPCPEQKPFSDKKTFYKILDSIKFTR